MLLLTRIGFALCGAALAALSFRGPIELPALVVVAAVSSLIFAIDTPTRTAVSPTLAAEGNSIRGQRVFNACAACHSLQLDQNMTGPNLAGLWNRKAGSVASFSRYSPALKSANIVWNDKTLDDWITDPQHLVPGNQMTFPARVQNISYCKDTYSVTTANGQTRKFWERNLRLKTDASGDGPAKNAPALIGAGMVGDRADVIFAAPEEISGFIKPEC